ncbi:hypothetical protein ACFE04_008332 [Oxalis oulophora]
MVRNCKKRSSKRKQRQRKSPRISSLHRNTISSNVIIISTTTTSSSSSSSSSSYTTKSSTEIQPPPTSIPPTLEQLGPQLGTHEYDDQQLVHNENIQKYEVQVTLSPDQSSSTLQIPEKCMLQLILDILQRKDTHEIFAEPVDPKEVEDYYEIIKEPMDFDTMRAKLHEGMYKTLEQFKRDVLLISRNAMQFNSPSTIFFRQARAIHELAIKVFNALKTDPKNLEFEFSEAKRRSSRRPLVGDKGPAYSLSPKRPGTNLRSNTTLTLQLKATPPNLQKIIPRDLSRHEVPSGEI